MTAKPTNRTRHKSPAAKPAPTSSPKTKKEQLIALLNRKGGQEMAQLVAALGWLPHTVRAALTGLRKSGLVVERVVGGDGRMRYRVVSECAR